MDKELLAIIPERERKGGSRVADLLVKVYLLDGSERWILINTEIEGGSDVHFSFRVYQYHYRILDHLQAPVETIVFFIGDRNQVRPSEYKYEGIMGTSTHFRYLSYHIFDHEESELLTMDNIFAYIVNLNSTILWSLRNKINRLGKAPLCGLIGISQAEATQHSVFI